MNIKKAYQINIADLTVDVVKKSIKNMHIAVYPPNGRVRVAVPENTSEESIRLFCISKISWIKKNKIKFISQRRDSIKEYTNGESVFFKGKRYLLEINNKSDLNTVKIKNKKYIQINIKTGTNPKFIKILYENWLKNELEKYCDEKIMYWEKVTKLKISSWSIRRMKNRWGSCNKNAENIIFNLYLVQKSEVCIDYVILHEILHLKEKTHNKLFTELLTKYLPNWKGTLSLLNSSITPYTKWSE